jgi:hypothetical protein
VIILTIKIPTYLSHMRSSIFTALLFFLFLVASIVSLTPKAHAQNGYASEYGVVNYADTTGSPDDFKDNGFYIIYHKEDGVNVSDSTIVCPTASGNDPVSGTIHGVTYTKIDSKEQQNIMAVFPQTKHVRPALQTCKIG